MKRHLRTILGVILLLPVRLLFILGAGAIVYYFITVPWLLTFILLCTAVVLSTCLGMRLLED